MESKPLEPHRTARVRYPAPKFTAQSWWNKEFKEIKLEQFLG